MNENFFGLIDICTEYQRNPLGLDCAEPRFSWKLKAVSGSKNVRQTAYRILVGKKQGLNDMWDSGKQESECSVGVAYAGKALEPCTRYYITLSVWATGCFLCEKSEDIDAEEGLTAREMVTFLEETAESWFETGFLNPSLDVWGGAQWIGAPEKYISTRTMGVFVISSSIRIHEGSRRAGIVFGANDERLMDPCKNQYEIAGKNYIRYVLDVGRIPAMLEIYRVG